MDTVLSGGYHLLTLVLSIVGVFILMEIIRRLRSEHLKRKEEKSRRNESYTLTRELALDPSENLVVCIEPPDEGDMAVKKEGNSKRIRKNFMKRFKEFKIE
ncbi:hypothetical protein TrRE_jg5023 [Triparma retinervis]|uniref:Uncharacterized protein n=1 Tax=Triparma retinervis TaxID=2557542 RepID=A0A9W7ADX5_9STRA|nr:hypothetical protein TrRE_jg5023 [Triparma retinervis]